VADEEIIALDSNRPAAALGATASNSSRVQSRAAFNSAERGSYSMSWDDDGKTNQVYMLLFIV
jgi:hypothetical protein